MKMTTVLLCSNRPQKLFLSPFHFNLMVSSSVFAFNFLDIIETEKVPPCGCKFIQEAKYFHTKEMIWANELNNQKGQSKAYKPEGAHGSRSVKAKLEDSRGSRSVIAGQSLQVRHSTLNALEIVLLRLIKKNIPCHHIIRNWK